VERGTLKVFAAVNSPFFANGCLSSRFYKNVFPTLFFFWVAFGGKSLD
jgi:hypothetical protein